MRTHCAMPVAGIMAMTLSWSMWSSRQLGSPGPMASLPGMVPRQPIVTRKPAQATCELRSHHIKGYCSCLPQQQLALVPTACPLKLALYLAAAPYLEFGLRSSARLPAATSPAALLAWTLDGECPFLLGLLLGSLSVCLHAFHMPGCMPGPPSCARTHTDTVAPPPYTASSRDGEGNIGANNTGINNIGNNNSGNVSARVMLLAAACSVLAAGHLAHTALLTLPSHAAASQLFFCVQGNNGDNNAGDNNVGNNHP